MCVYKSNQIRHELNTEPKYNVYWTLIKTSLYINTCF